jgi:twitching motility protein PilT
VLKPTATRADSGPMFDLHAALRYLVESDGSDLHLKVPAHPMIRVDGRLQTLPDSEPLKPDVTRALVDELVTADALREEFARENEVDLAFARPGWPAFESTPSSSVARSHSSCAPSPTRSRRSSSSGFPPVIGELADESAELSS